MNTCLFGLTRPFQTSFANLVMLKKPQSVKWDRWRSETGKAEPIKDKKPTGLWGLPVPPWCHTPTHKHTPHRPSGCHVWRERRSRREIQNCSRESVWVRIHRSKHLDTSIWFMTTHTIMLAGHQNMLFWMLMSPPDLLTPTYQYHTSTNLQKPTLNNINCQLNQHQANIYQPGPALTNVFQPGPTINSINQPETTWILCYKLAKNLTSTKLTSTETYPACRLTTQINTKPALIQPA